MVSRTYVQRSRMSCADWNQSADILSAQFRLRDRQSHFIWQMNPSKEPDMKSFIQEVHRNQVAAYTHQGNYPRLFRALKIDEQLSWLKLKLNYWGCYVTANTYITHCRCLDWMIKSCWWILALFGGNNRNPCLVWYMLISWLSLISLFIWIECKHQIGVVKTQFCVCNQFYFKGKVLPYRLYK